MTDFTSTWYANAGDQSTTGYYAVARRQAGTAVVVGKIVRQFTSPVINSERCFVCVTAGTTSGATDATWVTDRGARTTDGSVVWQECTGVAALNGDAVNTLTYAQAMAISTVANLGTIVKRNNGASYQIRTAAGVMGASEPAFSDTAGVASSDGVWMSLGPVGSFAGGGAPHARLQNAVQLDWFHSNNTIYVGDNHAESQNTQIDWGSVSLGGGRMLCHAHAGPYPPVALATGATVSLTAHENFNYTMSGAMYVYGLTVKVGVGVTTSSAFILLSPNQGGYLYCDNCLFWLAGGAAGNGAYIRVGGSSASGTVVFNNSLIRFMSTGNCIAPSNGMFIWQNTGLVLASGSAVPNTCFTFGTTFSPTSFVTLEAVDLSQIVGLLGYNTAGLIATIVIKDCKLNAAWGITSSAPAFNPGQVVQLMRSGSDVDGCHQSSCHTYAGADTTEIAITRVGGAVDPTNQPQSRKIVTTVNSQWLLPFQAEPYAIWNSAAGTDVTLTVHGTIQDVLPNNADIWLEVEYLGSSGSPLGTIVNTTKADVLAASAPVPADSSHWNGGGSGAGWSPFKLVAVLSSPQPGLPGYIHVRVRAAKSSTTFYIDPQVVLS